MQTVVNGRFGGRVFALVGAVLVAACGSSAPPAGPAVDKDAHLKVEDWREIMPAGAHVVVGVSVKRLAASSIVQRLFQLAERDEGTRGELDKLRRNAAECGVDLTRDLDTVVAAFYRGEADDAVVILVRGTFTEAVIAGCLTRIAQEDGAALQSLSVAGYNVYKSVDEAEDARVSVPVPNMMLVASSGELMEAALTAGTSRLGKDAPELGVLIERLPQDSAVWGAGLIPPDSEVARSIRESPLGEVVAKAPKAVYGHADAHDSMELHGSLLMDSAQDASQLLSWGSTMLDQVRPLAEAQGLGSMLGALTLGADKERVFADFVPGVQDVELLLQAVSSY